jgi:hypothetical protein
LALAWRIHSSRTLRQCNPTWQHVIPFPVAVLPVTGVDRLKIQLGCQMQEEDHELILLQPLHGDGSKSSICSGFRRKTLLLVMPRSSMEIDCSQKILGTCGGECGRREHGSISERS